MKFFRAKPFLAWIFILLAGITTIVIAGYGYLRLSLPVISGQIILPQLAHPVEVIRDQHDIPHIYASTANDAYFAIGYVHAQERLWQMEINRRIASGRLSELLGSATLDTDKFLRTLGIRHYAEATFPKLDSATQNALRAYSNGINAFIANHTGPLPIEFLVFGLHPEPWTPADSLGWAKMQAWDLGNNWKRELLRMQLATKLSTSQISEFIAPYPGDPKPVLPDLKKLYAQVNLDLTKLASSTPMELHEGAGSNNWVVNGQRSVTGKPLLANDPHLGLSAPSIWYFADLNISGKSVIGATLPGLPFVVLGHNRRIAWAFTNTGPDVQDLFLEKIDPDRPANYITPNGTAPFQIYNETIKVKGQPDFILPVRVTRHGPVISDVIKQASTTLAPGYVLSLAWTALRDDDLSVQATAKLGVAHNWQEFVAAARAFHSPQQNMLYADVDGNIGFIAPGRVPVRKPENDLQGLAPAPGWDAKYDWTGFIPFEALPQTYNPASGQLATANNKVVPPDYPYYITSEWSSPFRIRRIEQLLAQHSLHSTTTFMRMQGDVKSAMMSDLLPLLLKAPILNSETREIRKLLGDWNGEMSVDRPEPLIASAWLRELTRLIYADELGEMFTETWENRPLFIYNVLTDKDGQSRWCDDVTTQQIETCDQQIGKALELALSDLKKRYGGDIKKWQWGKAHLARFEHRPFAKQAVLARLFNVEVPVPGDNYSINVGSNTISNEIEPFAVTHAASLRIIYDLADLDRSQFMFASGQSGNVLSPFYRNLTEQWARVEYRQLTTKRSEVEAQAIGKLTLQPMPK